MSKISSVISFAVLFVGAAACSPTAPSPTPGSVSPPSQQTAVTFLQGTVRDTLGRPLSGVKIEVLDGPAAGRSTATNDLGLFGLTGTFLGNETLRATKEEYVSATRAYVIGVAFVLETLTPRVDIAGSYTLTITADSACTSLPEPVRSRTFGATFWGAGNILLGSVSDATFLRGHTEFDAFIAGNEVVFTTNVHGPGSVVEHIAGDTYLAIQGSAAAVVETPVATITGSFEGTIEYCVSANMGARYDCSASQARVQCASRHHQLVLTKK